MSTAQWSPRDEKNPFRIWTINTSEEWLEITRWYPFSIRVLSTINTSWLEQARTSTWENAKEIMQALGKSHEWTLIVMKCERRGKEGRERPVLWYPSEGIVRSRLRELRRISGENDDRKPLPFNKGD